MSEQSADTIRILVATDNHVGYAEDDPIRGDDGWKTFEEIMSLAESRDVDMVLLGGDLFHDHQPSRKALYHVMESLRKHCLGNKPCSVDIIGDESEHFRGQFNYANYNDPNLNISIPVFSIHGNHDEPTGQESLASLDILQTSGLINYFGRQAEADNIAVRPILMQKGTTKLALYGLSNVRDERLFQTFRSNNARFLQPSVQKSEWYNLLAVHQNHAAHTDTSYLPETFLPGFIDMVIWGHEHQCLIDPKTNPTKGFKVIQPGSSIATSFSPGEADPKHVCILNITGRDCSVEPIRLRTVRPFIYKDIALSASKEMVAVANKADNLVHVKKYCKNIVDGMIKKANDDWLAVYQATADDDDEPFEIPKPLIRLRIEYTGPPSGGDFKVEQNRRFSKEYHGQVANDTDVFQFHRRRNANTKRAGQADLPDQATLEQLGLDTVKISELIQEFLSAQALTLLPRNLFSDAVTQYVDKGDKKAMSIFVDDTMKTSVDDLVDGGVGDADELDDAKLIESAMNKIRLQQEERFSKGEIQARRGEMRTMKPKPDDWDSDLNGHWFDNSAAVSDEDEDDDLMLVDSDDDALPPTNGRATATATRGRGRGSRARGRGGRTATTTASTTRKASAAKKAPAKKAATAKARTRKRQPIEEEDDEDEDDDILMLDDNNDDDVEVSNDSGGLFVSQASSAAPTRKAPARATKSRAQPAASKPSQAASNTQTRLNFGSRASASSTRGTGATAAATLRHEPSDDEPSDDDAFETPAPSARVARHR